MSKYDVLGEYLSTLPAEEPRANLSFDKIEAVLGEPLPPTARIDRPWWANTTGSNHAAKWMKAGWKVDKVDLAQGHVTFVRIGHLPETTKARYDGLAAFLRAMPVEQEQLALTFNEIERIIEHPLPKTAVHDPVWWANTSLFSPQGVSWLSAGWEVHKAYVRGTVVVFRRKGNNPVRKIPHYVKTVLEGDAGLSKLSNETLAKWIRFCRRIGWYFEGAIIYERGGLSLDQLDEARRSAVDEDYSVCKQKLMLHKKL